MAGWQHVHQQRALPLGKPGVPISRSPPVRFREVWAA
eukprot:COSAG01_NODE_62330_length_285_cov_0.827957_1_plen_36_part_01